MPTSENVLDPTETPAVAPVPRPIDQALRYLSMSANHGRLWMGVAAALALTGKRGRRAAIRGLVTLGASSFVSNAVVKPVVGRRRPDIERTLVQQGSRQATERWLEKLRRNAYVKHF